MHNSPSNHLQCYSVPSLSIKPGVLTYYSQFQGHHKRKSQLQKYLAEAKRENEKYTGLMTRSAQKRLREVTNLLVAQAKWKKAIHPTKGYTFSWKINFITLTLSGPQLDVSDRTIKSKMLKPFLRRMKNQYGLRSYIWRAERQKNGRLHFHITADSWLQFDVIRMEWNKQQAKFHFIEYFRDNNDSIWPNSTDVHSVANIQNLAAYLVKYMAKSDPDSQKIEGKLWDCSPNLKTKEKVIFEMSSEDWDYLDEFWIKLAAESMSSDYCLQFYVTEKEMETYLPEKYLRPYKQFLERVYNAADQRGRVHAVYE